MNSNTKLKKQAEELSELTFLLARACEVKEKFFTKKFNLTSAEFRCMRLLDDNTKLNVKDIATKMKLSPSRITQIISSLEEKELINRKIDKKDRRNIIVSINKKAHPLVEESKIQHIQLHEKVLLNIDEDTREGVLIAIKTLLDSLNEWSKTINSKISGD